MSKQKGEPWSDPKLYRKLSEPKSSEQVDVGIKRFEVGLRSLREECGIADVAVVFQTPVLIVDAEGVESEGVASGSLHMGCEATHDVMVARHLGSMMLHRTVYLERFRSGSFD